MSVQAKIKASIRVDELKDNPITAGQPLNVHAADENITLTDGVTAGKFDAVWSRKEWTISSAQDIDLYGGLSDTFGTSFNAVEIVFYYIKNHSTTATLTLGGDGTQPAPLFADGGETIGPGGFRMGYFGDSASGWGTIGAGSEDIFQLTPSASLEVTIILGLRTS